MSELYLMVTITDRKLTKRFVEFYKEEMGFEIGSATLGHGTAASEVLDYFGLEGSEKVLLFQIATQDTWKRAKSGLRRQMKIDIPGTGIAFTVPLSAIGGKRALDFLTYGQEFTKGEESTLKDTKYELLVTIANNGYTELVMDAARAVHAAGGTVIHAKGTGAEHAEQFLGVTLVPEKEIVLIVVRSDQKKAVMNSIMEKAGLESKARSVVFSLPVTDTAGLRLMEEMEEE